MQYKTHEYTSHYTIDSSQHKTDTNLFAVLEMGQGVIEEGLSLISFGS